MNIFEYYEQHREEVKFAGYSVLMIVPAIVLSQMFEQAFNQYSALERSMYNITQVVPLLSFVTLVAMIFGVYIGLIILLLLDYKKKFQSIVLVAATLIVILVAISRGLFFKEMGSIGLAVTIISLTVTVFLIGGKDIRDLRIGGRDHIVELNRDEPIEFPRAGRLFVVISAGFVLVALIEAHTSREPIVQSQAGASYFNPEGIELTVTGSEFWIGMDILASFFFVLGLSLFIGYEAERRVVFIGPERSGKTHCILGLFIAAQNRNDARNPRGMIEPLKTQFIDTQDWLPPNEADDIRKMYFEYSAGKLFRKNIVVDGLDYPGEYSRYIAAGLRQVSNGMYIPNSPSDATKGELTHAQVAAHNSTEEIQKFITQVLQLQNKQNSSEAVEVEPTDNGYDLNNLNAELANDMKVMLEGMIGEVLPRVRQADTLVFMIDMNIHMTLKDENPNPLEGPDEAGNLRKRLITYYSTITATQNQHRRTIGVATKADKIRNEFTGTAELEFDAFADWISTELSTGPFGAEVNAMQLEPIPAYFVESEEDASPLFNAGQPQYYGYRELLRRLGR